MGDYGEKDKWVCPNDRELALRAKLQTGWSVKTGAMSTFTRQEQLNDSEQERIVGVIKRADMLEQMEQQRVGRLVERVENMKRNALGNGTTQCVLCANEFGLLSGSPLLCNDCRKAVCSKCSVDTFSAQREQIWLCKICSETREMWKKSGAWFYRALPNYVVPDKKAEGASKYSSSRNRNGTEATTAAIAGRGWHRGQNEKESTDSSDEESKAPKVNRRLISRKAMYDSTDSDSSAASPRIGASFPASPELASEKSRTGLEGASALEASYQDPGQALATDYVPSSRDMGAVARGEHSEVAPWRQRQHKDLSADDSDIDTGSCGRLGPYLVEDRSLDSLGSIGGTGRYVTAHLSRSPRRDPLDAEGDDSEYRAESMSMGTVEFSLLLLNSGRALKCIIHRAKGLYGTDYNGFSDPFVRVQLLPLTKTGDTKQTKTLHKTINPEFGETLVFHADEPLDARKLRLTVMDDYQFGSYPLGEATVPLSLLTPNQMCWLNVALDKCLDRDALCADRPRVLVSLMHCRRRRELHVGLLRCVRLRHAAAGTGPFVRITLKPDASQPSCETSTVKKMLSPQSNDEFAFELKENDNLEKKFLQISVWDKDQGRVDEYLGGLELGLHCKAAQLQHWLDVIRVPEQSFECWHALVPVPLLP